MTSYRDHNSASSSYVIHRRELSVELKAPTIIIIIIIIIIGHGTWGRCLIPYRMRSCVVGAVQTLQETSCYGRLGSRIRSTKHIFYAFWSSPSSAYIGGPIDLIDQTPLSSCYLGRYLKTKIIIILFSKSVKRREPRGRDSIPMLSTYKKTNSNNVSHSHIWLVYLFWSHL